MVFVKYLIVTDKDSERALINVINRNHWVNIYYLTYVSKNNYYLNVYAYYSYNYCNNRTH